MIFGAIDVLVPLEMDELEAGALAIAAVFLAAAGLEAIVAPVAGRVSDRRGRFLPCAGGLIAAIVTMLLIQLPSTAFALGAVVILAAPGIGMLWSPAMAMLSDGAEASGVNLGLAFGLTNLGWGLGHSLGAAVGARGRGRLEQRRRLLGPGSPQRPGPGDAVRAAPGGRVRSRGQREPLTPTIASGAVAESG